MVDVPAAGLAIAVHEGSFAELDRTYGTLGTYVAEREIAVNEPIREYCLAGPADGRAGGGAGPGWRAACGALHGAGHAGRVRVQGGVLLVVHEVNAEVVRADLAQLGEPVQVPLQRPEQAEPVDDVVRDECGRRVARPCRDGSSRIPPWP